MLLENDSETTLNAMPIRATTATSSISVKPRESRDSGFGIRDLATQERGADAIVPASAANPE